MKTINQRQLRNDSGAVLRSVEDGEVYIITRDGHPVAELRPLQGSQAFVSRDVLVAAFSTLPRTDATAWLADADTGLDTQVQDPWAAQ